MGFGVQGSRFKVLGSGFRVWGLGFRWLSSGLRVYHERREGRGRHALLEG